MSNRFTDRHWHALAALLTLVLWTALFWPVCTGSREFGFRDTASLYAPLFEWTAGQWRQGEIPLWCSLDNWGAPVVADATSSVFYPGQLIFQLSWLPISILLAGTLPCMC